MSFTNRCPVRTRLLKSSVDLTDGAIEGGDMQVLSMGVNWWPTSSASAGINVRNINLDRFGLRGNAKSLTARVSLFVQ